MCWQHRYFIPFAYICMKLGYIGAIIGTFHFLHISLDFILCHWVHRFLSIRLPGIVCRSVFHWFHCISINFSIKIREWKIFSATILVPHKSRKIRQVLLLNRIFWIVFSDHQFWIYFKGSVDNTWCDCLLPINSINNVVFIILWCWLWILLLLTSVGLLLCVIKLLPRNTERFLGQHLNARGFYKLVDDAVIQDFVDKCPIDIILTLNLYEAKLNCTFVGEIIGTMFQAHKRTFSSN